MCGAGLVSCPSPEGEGMERRKAQNTGTLRRRPPALRSAGSPSGAPAVASLVSGRSSGLGPTSMTSPDPGGIGAALQPVRVQPLKAAPSCDGAGGVRDDPGLWFAWTRDPGATPCSANQAHPRRRPQLSKACPEYRVGKRRKDYCDLECEFTGERARTEISPAASTHSVVIPGRSQSERTRNPDANSTPVSGFRVRRYAPTRNDGGASGSAE